VVIVEVAEMEAVVMVVYLERLTPLVVELAMLEALMRRPRPENVL
jgi:hypothetical protein